MRHVASPSPPVTWLRPALLVLGALQLAQGLALLLAPRAFYDAVADFGPYNPHDLRDMAAFYLAATVALVVAAGRPSWRAPVLALIGLQYLFHALNHVLDAGDADPSWIGPLDVVTLGLGAAVLYGLYRAASREAVAR